ncbi:MAG TPA: cytochrome c biogenesis protein CcdA [Flavobacterium sp.]|jgi:thiol:disulfide interchange protein DsbD
MKKILFLLLSFFVFANSAAQILDPVKWKTRTEKISDSEFNLVFEGRIEPEWHVYSQFTPEDGPLPLELIFNNAKNNYTVVGKAKESPYKKQFNEVFEVDEYYFEKSFTLKQRVKILNPAVGKIKVGLNYQVCKEVCINQEKDFSFAIPKPATAMAAGQADTITDSVAPPADSVATGTVVAEPAIQAAVPESEPDRGLAAIFFFAFLGGFAALLTPCVFPMIPMTVSFFTKQSKNKIQGKRNAIIYGVSIILIYLVLGSVVTAVFGAEALNALSTDVWFNLIFFILLVVFAVSFLGAFEIMLPNSWANKVDRQADRGGIIGILFMALALAIVSFSCTGPIVGTLLVQAASQGGIAPVVGMLGFSTALALPFMLFAMFPGWLNSLPKSGGWLNTVKVSLGFLELALALKFLSNADLVLQLHYLEREVFLALWIAIFGVWGIYLLGKITLPHDSPLPSISVGRLGLGLVVLSFTVYMIPGLWGAPLKLISAFPPPQTYSESPVGFGNAMASETKSLPEGAEFGPHGIVAFTDYDKGLAYAKKVNKPILIDFTGYACVNCRKMENNVWSEEQVLKILKNDVVLISLYVDDKRKLPENEQTISKETGKKIVTIGNKWTDFIITRYKTNTQPYYVLSSLDGNNLIAPISYTPDAEEYENWLKTGIKNFR